MGERRSRRRPAAGRPRGRRRHVWLVPLVVLATGIGLGLAVGAHLETGGTPAAVARTGTATPAAAPPGRAAVAGDRADATGAPSAVPARAADVQGALDERARALLARDRRGWLADVSTGPTASGYRSAQASVFDRLAGVPIDSWAWTYLGEGPALSASRARALPAGAWVGRFQLAWSLEGAGSAPVHRLQDLTVVPVAARGGSGGWALAGDADGDTQVDLWDLGDVSVVRSSRAVVLGTAARADLLGQARLVDAAASTVDATWGTAWPRVSVVEVPSTTDQMAALLSPSGRRGAGQVHGLDQLAAVTTGELVGDVGATTGDHVVVNPEGFARLSPKGQQVVLTHELTHVATRSSAARAVPTWLSEGFADWIAYSRSGLTRQQVAGDLLGQVRADGPPAALPVGADFDAASTDVGPAYSGAWLAVQLLARDCGAAGVVATYRRTSGTPGSGATGTQDPEAAFDQALGTTCHLDRPAFVAAWRAWLQQLSEDGTATGRSPS